MSAHIVRLVSTDSSGRQTGVEIGTIQSPSDLPALLREAADEVEAGLKEESHG